MNFVQVRRGLAYGRVAGIQRRILSSKPAQRALVLLDDLLGENAVAITRNHDGQLAELAMEHLRYGYCILVAGRRALVVAQVMDQFRCSELG